ncbi:MAG: MBL fold metallo-hydrolase [Oscillospiraceae bacterium]|nr:MBL fold metallo-hydrolase [Oscillospiraceae bacterium]
MKIINLVSGAFQTNTYVLINGDNAAVIDPEGSAERILDSVENRKVTDILLTHGHFDHTSAAESLKKLTAARIHIHEKDAPMLTDPDKAFSSLFPRMFKPCEADSLLKDGDMIKFGDTDITVMHTPGHSGGSVMYIVHDDSKMGTIFSGDTLFADSVGRVDGWSGNHYEQMESLEKIKSISGEYRILPGHGEETTLEKEKKHNPFLCGF